MLCRLSLTTRSKGTSNGSLIIWTQKRKISLRLFANFLYSSGQTSLARQGQGLRGQVSHGITGLMPLASATLDGIKHDLHFLGGY